MDEDQIMKTLFKYTIATFVVAGSIFAGAAEAGFLSGMTCTAALGKSVKPKDQAKQIECAQEEGDKNPNFVAAFVTANCADGAVTAGLEDACEAAVQHKADHDAAAAAKASGAAKTGKVKQIKKLTADVAKDTKIVADDGTKTETDQAKLEADQAALDALNGQ